MVPVAERMCQATMSVGYHGEVLQVSYFVRLEGGSSILIRVYEEMGSWVIHEEKVRHQGENFGLQYGYLVVGEGKGV